MKGLKSAYQIKFNDTLSATERLNLSPYLYKAFSKYLDFSDDDFTELIKSKKIKSSRIWLSHQHKPQAELEDWFYLYLADPMLGFQNAVLKQFGLGAARESLRKALPKYDTGDIDIIDRLIEKYFPSPAKNKAAAEMIAVRGHLLGLIRSGETPALEYKTINVFKLPKTVKSVMEKYKVKPDIARSMIFAKDFTGSLIQTQVDKVKENTKRIVLDAYRNNDPNNKIRTKLFEELGDQNRDWRRIAVTEVSYGDNNGYIESLTQGEWVIGSSAPDACEHCKELIHGKIYQKVDTPGEWNKEVWVGKTNYDRYASHFTRDQKTGKWVKRSDSEIWMPTIPVHPNCRCNWVRFHPEMEWIDKDGFGKLKAEDPKKYEQWYETFKKKAA